MNGCTRQKNVYVPGFRLADAVEESGLAQTLAPGEERMWEVEVRLE